MLRSHPVRQRCDLMEIVTSGRMQRCRQSSGPARTVSSSIQSDAEEPPHVHVERDENSVTFWLSPVRLQSSGGFAPVEVRRIQRLVDQHREALLRSWDAYFKE